MEADVEEDDDEFEDDSEEEEGPSVKLLISQGVKYTLDCDDGPEITYYEYDESDQKSILLFVNTTDKVAVVQIDYFLENCEFEEEDGETLRFSIDPNGHEIFTVTQFEGDEFYSFYPIENVVRYEEPTPSTEQE